MVEVGFERNSGTLQPKHHNTKNILKWCSTSLIEPFHQGVCKLHSTDISDYNTWKGDAELGDIMIYSLHMGNEVDLKHMKPLGENLG